MVEIEIYSGERVCIWLNGLRSAELKVEKDNKFENGVSIRVCVSIEELKEIRLAIDNHVKQKLSVKQEIMKGSDN